jgi:hypothetical protein
VVRKGARNILAQNDWHDTTTPWHGRANLSLFFSRGNRNDDFVGALNFTYTDGPVGTTRVDYPQFASNGTTGAVIYTKFNTSDWASSITKVAKITPLPDDNRYFIFPRRGHHAVDALTIDGRSAAVFYDDYSSAGIDVDANTTANTLHITFAVKPHAVNQQTLLYVGDGGSGNGTVKLCSSNGRLVMKQWSGTTGAIDCGALPLETWSTVDFITGPSGSKARANGGAYASFPTAPYPWTPYFGDNIYSQGQTPDAGPNFAVDLASISMLVQ